MKYYLLLIPLSAVCLSGCSMVDKINESTCEINRNTDAIERSTEAVNSNIAELERMKKSNAE